jgi:hypothetical protein
VVCSSFQSQPPDVRLVASGVREEAQIGPLWVGDAGLPAHAREIGGGVEHLAAVRDCGARGLIDIFN